jgi:hypothetical protein
LIPETAKENGKENGKKSNPIKPYAGIEPAIFR